MRGIAARYGVGQKILSVLLAGMLIAGLMLTAGASDVDAKKKKKKDPKVAYWLTVLHNNDGESKLLNAPGQPDFGGVAHFASLVDEVRTRSTGKTPWGVRKGTVMVSSGDNFLAGPEFNASRTRNEEKDDPYYDSMALSLIDYDAMAIGNHEFDFGPDILAEFIDGFGTETPPFVSANLDFSEEARLAALEEEGIIADSTIVTKRGERIGIIGATTPDLPQISSPRNVTVDLNLVAIVQDEIDSMRFRKARVDKIMLISHLQDINQEVELVSSLRGIDLVVGGGGGELLANEGDRLVPGDDIDEEPADGVPDALAGPYPIIAEDARGRDVPVVTTNGNYKYLGFLRVGFNKRGRVIKIKMTSGPVRVAGGGTPDAVEPNRRIQRWVEDPVERALEELANNVIADSEVTLDGRASVMRTQETNEGNLVADSLLWQAARKADEFDQPQPDISLQNSGGIRNDSEIPPGDITELNTYQMLAFFNLVAIVPDVSSETLKALLERSVEESPGTCGCFAQISGFSYTYDNSQPVGERVNDVTLDDSTPLVVDGVPVPGETVNVATIDFLARGGDGYPFGDADFTVLGVTYQEALFNYLTSADGLDGQITAEDYPEGGEGRITEE